MYEAYSDLMIMCFDVEANVSTDQEKTIENHHSIVIHCSVVIFKHMFDPREFDEDPSAIIDIKQ